MPRGSPARTVPSSRAGGGPTRCRGNRGTTRNRLATTVIGRSIRIGSGDRPRRWSRIVPGVVERQRVGGTDSRQLAAKQVEFLSESVEHPVDLTGLVAAQGLGELHRIDVGTGD